MSNSNKPSIPAWQRAKPPTTPPADDPVYSQPESNAAETGESSKEDVVEPNPTEDTSISSETGTTSSSSDSEPEPVPSDTTSPTTAPHPDALPPKPQPTTTFTTSDFSRYQQQSIAPPQPQPQPPQPQARPPPIITYPEFLLTAHKPPPLITPSRVITTLYAATGISALLYGANRWLVTPMVQSLSESRHDLLTHSTSKVDEFNSRLEKIVSKIPVSPKKDGEENEKDDVEEESVDSDPTELYHRDMGTQTSDLPSPSPPAVKKSPVDHETAVLGIMTSHFAELSDSSDKVGEAHKDRQITINKFRHLLDGMVYNMDGLPTWEAGADGGMVMKAPGAGKGDAIEDLKKEIRGVKGVLLSARRFPAARVGATPA